MRGPLQWRFFFSDCDVDPDYVEDIASDLGSVPRVSKRKVSPLAF